MSTQASPVTADELLRMPRGRVQRELIRGEVREMPLNGREHGRVTSNFLGSLGQHVRATDVGECFAAVGFQLAWDPDTVIAPDVSFVTRERDDEAGPGDGYFPGPPDLAAEVRNFDEAAEDVLAKARMWITEGARMAFVLDPIDRTATVLRPGADDVLLTDADVLDGGDVVPGWKESVRALLD
jgi:Uma2 family endonuclease